MKAATVNKWGNSLGIRFPEAFANILGISAGDKVEISVKDNTMQIKKIHTSKCRQYLESFYGKPYDELLKENFRNEKLLDWGSDQLLLCKPTILPHELLRKCINYIRQITEIAPEEEYGL